MTIAREIFDRQDEFFGGNARRSPFPAVENRDPWDRLPDEMRRAIVESGEKALGSEWPRLRARDFMEFKKTGNRSNFQQLYFDRRAILGNLVLAECVSDNGRYVAGIVDALWSLCEESSWCIPAHHKGFSDDGGLPDWRVERVDLFAAETSALLSCVLILMENRLLKESEFLVGRIKSEIERRFLDVLLAHDDYWWMGLEDASRYLNNWTPWIVSNWLLTAFSLDDNLARRMAGVYKAVGCLDRYLVQCPPDGGCDEGPNYWGRAAASVLDSLEVLRGVADAKLSFYDSPLLKAMGGFIVKTHIADDWFVNFADGSARPGVDGALVYRYGVRTGDNDMMRLGAMLYQRAGQDRLTPDPRASLYRFLLSIFECPVATDVATPPPPQQKTWMPNIEVMTATAESQKDGRWFLAAKGGHNRERHNHNDVGSFIVFHDDAPLLIDAGVGVYTEQTFSDRRYEIWSMQSQYHNWLPTFDGVGQQDGLEFRAGKVEHSELEEGDRLAMELQKAYPAVAGVSRWKRVITLREGGLVVEDNYELSSETRDIALRLLTPSRPVIGENGEVLLESRALPGGVRSAAGRLIIEAPPSRIEVETIDCDDPRLEEVWGACLYAVKLVAEGAGRVGRIRLEVGG